MLHPTIPENLRLTYLTRKVRYRLVVKSSDALQSRCRTAATIWMMALLLSLGAAFLADGYHLILSRIQSAEFAAVGSAFFGLFVVTGVLAITAPVQSALARSAETMVRRRPNLTFVVHPLLNAGLAILIGGAWLIAGMGDAESRVLMLPWRGIFILIGIITGTYILGEWLATRIDHIPNSKRVQVSFTFIFFGAVCLLAGLRAPEARLWLAKDPGVNQLSMALIRAPFDADGDLSLIHI